MDSKILEELAAIAVAPNAEEALPPLAGVPDLLGTDGEVFACGATGHGIASWFFRLVMRTPEVMFDVTLPCWRVLDGEEARKEQESSIRTVCRIALIALGTEGFPGAGKRLEVSAGEIGDCHWRLVSDSGEEPKSDSGWDTLVKLLEQAGASRPGVDESLAIRL